MKYFVFRPDLKIYVTLRSPPPGAIVFDSFEKFLDVCSKASVCSLRGFWCKWPVVYRRSLIVEKIKMKGLASCVAKFPLV